MACVGGSDGAVEAVILSSSIDEQQQQQSTSAGMGRRRRGGEQSKVKPGSGVHRGEKSVHLTVFRQMCEGVERVRQHHHFS
ncbi:hypothetical protein E2C01_062796 [Portunus trituberculatus]|uniref:Uncharacterized protein n=1 Tax=Portunus trituberculatus TaxID=210409 RepID=A0A5B7HJ26_PORTR|nr:hypothetical protein [Portunus trituberculatus]